MFLYWKRNSTTSAAASANCIAKAKANLFLLGFQCSGHVNKLIGTNLVNKILGHESSLALSNTYQTNPFSREFKIIFVHSK